MAKNRTAKRWITAAVSLVVALGMMLGVFTPAYADETTGGASALASEEAFAYDSTNVILSKTAKAYAFNAEEENKMGDEITAFQEGPHNSGSGNNNISQVTNGTIHYSDGLRLGASGESVVGWITVDAGQEYSVHSVVVDFIHDWGAADIVIQLSTDEDFAADKTVTVFNNDIDGSLGLGDVITADFSDAYTESVKSGVLLNGGSNVPRTFEFAPVTARYIRYIGETVGNNTRQGYTAISELQMYAYETVGTAGPASVAPVTFSSPGGTFGEAANVTLSAAEGATIYYTTDGSVPTKTSTEYTGVINTANLSNACVIRAAAEVDGTLGLPTHGTFAHGFTGNPNVALGQSVKFYKVDTTAENKMGEELIGSGVRGNLETKEGYFKDGQSFSNAVNGDFGENSLSILNAEWQNKIPGSSTTGENIYGTGVTTESGGSENLWEMKEYFWTVVDFGEIKDINSVQVAFVGDTRGVCIQLSNDENFENGVTTVYCDSSDLGTVTTGASVGANWADNNKEITLDETVNARYIRATGWAVSDARYWTHNVPAEGEEEDISTNTFYAITSNYETLEDGQIKEHFIGTNLAEVAAMIATTTIEDAPALQAYVTSANNAFGEAITLESVANGSSADDIIEKLPSTVNLVDSDGKTYSNVSGTWTAPEGFNGSTAGTYRFTFVYENEEGDLPADAYGAATVDVTVEESASLTDLEKTLNEAGEKQETDYTTSTWSAFASAKTAAEEVKNATLKTQREVDQANSALAAAMNALAERADVSNLSAEFTKHADKTETDYTTSTWSAFALAKTAAQGYVNDASDATQAEVDQAKAALEAAAAALALRADTNDLSAAYNAANTEYGTGTTSSVYTQQSWSDYLEAMETAKIIIEDNSDATQAQADAAQAAIEAAIEGFVEKAASADIEALLAEVTKLRADESKYTVASYTEFKPILSATEDAVGGSEVTKEAFDAAKAAFDEAKAKLVEVGDATELNALIATQVEAQSAYTTASWKAYTEALSAANTAAAGGKSQAEIDAAKTALQSAIDGLVKIGDKTALAELIETAKAEKSISEDLANAINAAQEVMDNAEASEAEVDEATAALQSALDGNNKSGGCGSSIAGSGFVVAFVLAAGALVLFLKKRKENNINDEK